ncbi:hypothetical protein [Myxococcus stipitatus]|uniref:hypothetical protein n=1 Tax=Myxococcus stipitatus TaxID=83455 RepID=UPI0030CB7A12
MSRYLPLLTLALWSLGLSACAEDDACTELTTCGACASAYVDLACKWCPSDSTCSLNGENSSCEYQELRDDPAECGASSSCTQPYKGPSTPDIAATLCGAAYQYACQGDTSKRDENCRAYTRFQTDHPGSPSCPHCP